MCDPKLFAKGLSGRVYIVTGANSGSGFATTKQLAEQGAHVIGACRRVEAGEEAFADLGDIRGSVEIMELDLASLASVRRFAKAFLAKYDRLDGLVNNAGGMVRRVAYADQTMKDYDDVMDLNARSVIVASHAAIPHLKKAGGGFIINTTSIAARNGASGGAGLYGSSKAFVSNVTRGMAKELIAFGIRVNAVSPGVITTPFHERYSTKEQLEAALATIPQGRLGVAEDCVGAYLFLASASLSGYIIGQVLEVNGGQMMP
jgi:3-oxoacyl-[acyl-carrier protein] reductase